MLLKPSPTALAALPAKAAAGFDAGKAASAVGDGFKSMGTQAMGGVQWLWANAASKLNSVIQFILVLAILVVIVVAEVRLMRSGATCAPGGATAVAAYGSGLAVASWAVAAALILLVLSSVADLFLAGKKQAGEAICTAAWRKLNISLLGWGLLIASLVWQGYELFANGMGADAKSGTFANCPSYFYKPMSIVWCILIAVFIFYALLVLLVVSVACCGGSVKPAPAAKDDNGKPIAATGAAAVTGYASTAWSFVLNFFGLDDLTPEPAPPATGGAKAAAEPTTDASASLLASSASA